MSEWRTGTVWRRLAQFLDIRCRCTTEVRRSSVDALLRAGGARYALGASVPLRGLMRN
jgi:hypothetical protein